MSLRIGIVGGGTAGQAFAILCARQGHDVTVFEQAPQFGPVGAGLLIQPTGLSILRRLGVATELLDLGSPIHRLYGTTHRGRNVLSLAYRDLDPRLHGLGVRRSALNAVLFAAMTELTIDIQFGVTACSFNDDRDGFLTADGQEHGPFDLLVAADGARSSLRASLPHLVRRDRRYRWGALWFIGEDRDTVYGDTLRQFYRGTQNMIGFLPSGRASHSAPPSVSLFWSLPLDHWAGAEHWDLESWKATVRQLTPDAEPLLSQITASDQLVFAPYHDVIMRRPYEGRVVFLGDSSHAMSPQLGQGVNLALLDASVLADTLTDHASLAEAFSAFHRIRRRNVAFYHRASRWLTPFFQSNMTPVGLMRDVIMGPMCHAPFVRHQMLLSLCGVKTGALTANAVPSNMP
ncbi:MAG: NAD(P)/FAD-dependent oxidoreductase [Planctomycetota bacterium]